MFAVLLRQQAEAAFARVKVLFHLRESTHQSIWLFREMRLLISPLEYGA